MTRLIKSDYKKFFKDKLFIVVCILAVVFAATTPILYAVMFRAMGNLDPVTEEMLTGYVNAKGQFFSSFSFGNNLGLIAPLLIGIILYKDFSFGTIRNKIISGHSRLSILASNYIVCATSLFGIVLLSALLTLAISLPFFGYQETPFVMADFWYLIQSILFELCIYLFVSAFICWLCVFMKNIGMVIVLYIAVVFGFTMIAGVLMAIISIISLDPGMESTVKVLEFFQKINVFNSSAGIGLGTTYNFNDTFYYAIWPLLLTFVTMCHGALKFRRKDLK